MKLMKHSAKSTPLGIRCEQMEKASLYPRKIVLITFYEVCNAMPGLGRGNFV